MSPAVHQPQQLRARAPCAHVEPSPAKECVNWRELYDLDADPYQLSNLWFNISESTRDALAKRLAQEWRCVGAACL